MAKTNNKAVYLVALLLFLGGVGYLVFSGFSQNSVYFLNVSEAVAMTPEKLKTARLFGTVKEQGLQHFEEGPGVSFLIEDQENKGLTMRVVYKGAVPDTFKPGVEVIVEGGLDTSVNEFKAKTLMTKCPSKYQKENRS